MAIHARTFQKFTIFEAMDKTAALGLKYMSLSAGVNFGGAKPVPIVDLSAEQIQKYLAQHHRKKADYIISGLPWANMPINVQEAILSAVLAALAPEGMFTTFSYVHAFWLPRARRFRERLEHYFSDVKTSRIVWRNLPPAFVYRCRLAA